MASIFICHASEDASLAESIQLSLLNDQHAVFFDERSLPAGVDYNARIMAAIESCDLFIFLVSQHSIAHGRYTLSELRFAQERWPNPKGFVLTVNVDDTPMQNIPNYLKATTILNIAGDTAAEVRSAVLRILKPKRKKMLYCTVALVSTVGIAILATLYFHPESPKTNDSMTCEWKPSAAFDGRVGKVRVINTSLYPFTISFYHPDNRAIYSEQAIPGRELQGILITEINDKTPASLGSTGGSE